MGDITNVNELSVAAQVFYDTATGNTGFGTSSPLSKVAINGGLHVGGDIDPGDNNLAVDGTATISTISAATTDTDKFLVSDSGTVKFRTGVEVLSDIGAAAATHYHSSLMASDGNPNPAVSVDASGNMGIGTSTPSAKLQINDTNPQIIMQSSANGYCRIAMGDTISGSFGLEGSTGGNLTAGSLPRSALMFTSYAYPVQFGTNNAVRMTIDSDGNVGIGTATPDTILHLKSTTTPVIKIEDSDGAVGGKILLKNGAVNVLAANNLGIIDFSAMVGGVESRMARISAGAGASNTQEGKIQFWTANGADVSVRITIAKDGSVGIGTATPAVSLDVRGDVHIGTNGGELFFPSGQYSVNCGYNDNADASLTINDVGYLGADTKYRSLGIGNGKGATIAAFDGATKKTTLYGDIAFGLSGEFYTLGGSLDSYYDANDDEVTLYINKHGYQGGYTLHRALSICDGMNNQLARFDARENKTYFYGKINNTTLTEYASNCLAIAGGLVTGDFYRNGNNVCVVHA